MTLAAGLGLVTGDSLGFAASDARSSHSDYALVSSYDNVTGQLVLDRPLTHYHYGASQSTGADFNGVDMRGEVYILSRNVKIQGEDSDGWGCQIVTSDELELSGKIRAGKTYLYNVEVYNCSQ